MPDRAGPGLDQAWAPSFAPHPRLKKVWQGGGITARAGYVNSHAGSRMTRTLTVHCELVAMVRMYRIRHRQCGPWAATPHTTSCLLRTLISCRFLLSFLSLASPLSLSSLPSEWGERQQGEPYLIPVYSDTAHWVLGAHLAMQGVRAASWNGIKPLGIGA